MKKQTYSLWLPTMLALVLGLFCSATRLNAQQSTTPSNQQPSAQQQQPPAQQQQQPDQNARPAPDSQAQSDSSSVFNGTIVKTNNKFTLQEASGKAYDLDRQDLAKQYEGKQVRVKGTLDPDGKTIHVK